MEKRIDRPSSGCRKLLPALLVILLAVCMTVGCGSGSGGGDKSETSTKKKYTNVADQSEMIDEDAVVLDGMEPIPAADLNDGDYPITVSASSRMFPVTDCTLTVKDGKMTALMVMSGTGYTWVYPGTGQEAAEADESDYIDFGETEDGKHTFTIPVENLNAAVPCASFSKKKQKWYNRLLCFRADSLPANAFKEGVLVTAESLKLEEGEYTAEVILGGGTGRADIDSPAKIKAAKDGTCTLVLAWSSPNYDYMLVNGDKYEPVNTEGNSVFEIPLTVFDMPFAVIADTTAMSQPYEISYTLRVDSSSIAPAKK